MSRPAHTDEHMSIKVDEASMVKACRALAQWHYFDHQVVTEAEAVRAILRAFAQDAEEHKEKSR